MPPMMRFLSRSALALAVLGAIFTACGDDDPVAGGSVCLDENTSCLMFRAKRDDATYTSEYDFFDDETRHILSWDVSTASIPDYGPGRRIIVSVTFDPPLVVKYDHPFQSLLVGAGLEGGCFDRFAQPAPNFSRTGDWPIQNSGVNCMGDCTAGALRLELGATLSPLETGERLSGFTYDFTVPETYTSGGASGTAVLAGDLAIFSFSFRAIVDGDSSGDPPVWHSGFAGPPQGPM